MKKMIALMSLVIVAAVVAPSLASAEGNGITLFAIGPVALDNGMIAVAGGAADRWGDNYVEGSSAGGSRADKDVYNGITDFGSALPAPSGNERPAMDTHNGITLFSTQPVVSD